MKLTDEEIDLIANDGYRNVAGGIYATSVYAFARAIEQAVIAATVAADAVAPADLSKLPWLDQSTADPIEKARRVLYHLVDGSGVYFYDDGFPRTEVNEQAANVLAVLNALAAAAPVVHRAAEQAGQQPDEEAAFKVWFKTAGVWNDAITMRAWKAACAWMRTTMSKTAVQEPRNVEGLTRAEFEHRLRVAYQHDNVRAQERGIGPKWSGPIGLTHADEREIAERVECNYPTEPGCPGCVAFDSGASEVEFVQGCDGCVARMRKIAGFDTTRAATVAESACPFCDAVHDGNSCMEAYRQQGHAAPLPRASDAFVEDELYGMEVALGTIRREHPEKGRVIAGLESVAKRARNALRDSEGMPKALATPLPCASEVAAPGAHTYASTQATNCARCGEHKHTPLRIDWMGGYVCLTCIDKELEAREAAQPDAFDVALDALDAYQRNWDTGLPAEYAQTDRIAMECAVEAVREALNDARVTAPQQVAEATQDVSPAERASTSIDMEYWNDNRAQILGAIEKAGFRLESNRDGFWLQSLALQAEQSTTDADSPFADDDERDLFIQTFEEFEDCNETATDDRLLMKWACAGLLECSNYLITEKGQDTFDAARAASSTAEIERRGGGE